MSDSAATRHRWQRSDQEELLFGRAPPAPKIEPHSPAEEIVVPESKARRNAPFGAPAPSDLGGPAVFLHDVELDIDLRGPDIAGPHLDPFDRREVGDLEADRSRAGSVRTSPSSRLEPLVENLRAGVPHAGVLDLSQTPLRPGSSSTSTTQRPSTWRMLISRRRLAVARLDVGVPQVAGREIETTRDPAVVRLEPRRSPVFASPRGSLPTSTTSSIVCRGPEFT